MVLSEDIKDEIKEQFSLFDKSGQNTIESNDLIPFFKSFGINLLKTKLDDIMNSLDPSKSGQITLGAMLTLFDELLAADKFNEDEVAAAFQVFDRMNNGTITTDDLKKVLTTYGNCFTAEEYHDMIRHTQVNASGSFNYREFIRRTMKS